MHLWLIKLGVVIGLIVIACVLLQYREVWKRKIGVWFLIGSLGTTVWFCTDSGIATTAAVLSWFAFPLGQAFMVSRRMRYSPERQLNPGVLNIHEFGDVHFISQELKQQDFRIEGDHWLKPSVVDQGFRLVIHRDKPIYGAVAVAQQGGMNLTYTIFGTQARDGSVWLTWDYPLAFGFKMPPHFNVYRCLEVESVKELFDQHEAFLELNGVEVATKELQARDVKEFFDQIFRSTILYNLKIGLLKPTGEDDGEVLYSWKGTAFITWQVFREMVIG